MIKKLLIVGLFFLCRCSHKNDFTPLLSIPAEFQPYVDSFVAAASERGHNIVVDNLIISYDSSVSNMYCAYANVTSLRNDVQKIIYINPHIHCWQNHTQLETLIFHEMGHCILGRDHDTTRMPKGDPKSIMYPGDVSLYAPCVYPIGDSCNKLYKRGYYLDELFDSNTPVPDWAK
ncbi:MAG TPA: hypothetical protein VGQ53_15175 [Chitinophagaceae bacterium]|jgi:hypothetical protein|nr:hypothetical protein [Chitinophagaceae bacterium]